MLPALLWTLLTPALACGGAAWADLGAILRPPASDLLSHLAVWDEAAETEPALTRMLYSLRPTDPAMYAALDAALAGEPGDTDPGGHVARARADLQASLGRGDLDAARSAALALVEATYDLPAPLAEAHRDDLRLAVELIELRRVLRPGQATAAWFASLDADPAAAPAELRPYTALRTAPLSALPADPRHPRAASIRWRQLLATFTQAIPDGWSREDIRDQAPPGAFRALHAAVDAWLADFPDHPLADHARLKKVRLHYLAGEDGDAWALLLTLLPRHPGRVINELRFLRRQGMRPVGLDSAALPVPLAIALSDTLPPSPARWQALWTATLTPSPWSLAAQERLLLTAVQQRAEGVPLPPGFPAAPAAPSLAWSELRLAALLLDGDDAGARAQLDLLPPDHPTAPEIRAHLLLRAGDPVAALRTPGLDPDALRYHLRILAEDAVLEALIDDPAPLVAWESRLSLASRHLVDTGDWAYGASLLAPVDPDRAALWREAARVEADRSPAGLLKAARFFRAHGGQLFVRADHDEVVWYRSLPTRGGAAYGEPSPLGPPHDEQVARTEDWLRRSFATWRALAAYAEHLDRLDVASLRGRRLREARAVLDEADAVYNLLLNYGSGDGYAWAPVVQESTAAKTIRRVGAELRARLP